MNQTCLTEANVRMEYIPAHKYVGIWEKRATGYGDFWKWHSCDEVLGVIESMRHVAHPVVGCHTAGWRSIAGNRSYFYGFGVPVDYTGKIPDGFEIREFPESYYLVFFHPPFDYPKDCGEVMARVEALAWNYDISKEGFNKKRFAWNEDACQIYQRHCPDVLGYEVLRPVVEMK